MISIPRNPYFTFITITMIEISDINMGIPCCKILLTNYEQQIKFLWILIFALLSSLYQSLVFGNHFYNVLYSLKYLFNVIVHLLFSFPSIDQKPVRLLYRDKKIKDFHEVNLFSSYTKNIILYVGV